jgi:hypothetical protein
MMRIMSIQCVASDILSGVVLRGKGERKPSGKPLLCSEKAEEREFIVFKEKLFLLLDGFRVHQGI